MSSLIVALICLIFCGLDFLRPVPQILFVIFAVCSILEILSFFMSLFSSGSSGQR